MEQIPPSLIVQNQIHKIDVCGDVELYDGGFAGFSKKRACQ